MQSTKIEMLFSLPRTELYTRLIALIGASTSVSAVVGFLTEEGVSLIEPALAARPSVLSRLVVGATTLKACDGLDALRAAGVKADCLRVHLGHTRGNGRKFVKYHPMMHSKVYLFEGSDRSTVIIGSHNLTGFAIGGQNTEASVLVEASPNDPLINQVRDHISAVSGESQVYDPALRLAYSWWFKQAIDGMRYKVLYGSGEEGVERERNVLAIAVRPHKGLPKCGEVVYLEVPRAFKALDALDVPVHLYLLDQPPGTVADALGELPTCQSALLGRVIGTNERVVKDGEAQWRIRDLSNPLLESTTGRVSPTSGSGSVQAFVEITGSLETRYEYLFEPPGKWEPVYDDSQEGTILAAEQVRTHLAGMKLIPPEHSPWYRVIGLQHDQGNSEIVSLERDVSPESGRFLLLSKGRKPLAENLDEEEPLIAAELPLGVPANVWFAVSSWKKDQPYLQGWQRRLAFSLGRLARDQGAVSGKQAIQGKKLLLEAVQHGFVHAELTSELLEAMRSSP